jgi:hypothetical protein
MQAEGEAASLVVKQVVSTAISKVLYEAARQSQSDSRDAEAPATRSWRQPAESAGPDSLNRTAIERAARDAVSAAGALYSTSSPIKEVNEQLLAVVDDLLGLLEQSSRNSEQQEAR